jgi:hypothetical protein
MKTRVPRVVDGTISRLSHSSLRIYLSPLDPPSDTFTANATALRPPRLIAIANNMAIKATNIMTSVRPL